MIIDGKLEFNNREIEFLSFVKNNEIKIYLKNDKSHYNIKYMIANFADLPVYYAIKEYYESGTFFKHIKEVLDGKRFVYSFSYFSLRTTMKLISTNDNNNTIAKIKYVFPELTTETLEDGSERYFLLIKAVACVKTLLVEDNGRKNFVFDEYELTLSEYKDIRTLKKFVELTGQYINLESEEFLLVNLRQKNCSFTNMKEDEHRTIKNFVDSGFFRVTNKGLVDVYQLEQLEIKLRNKLQGIISPKLINELLNY